MNRVSSGQEVEFLLVEAVCLEERRQELEKKFKAYPRWQNFPVAKSLEEAHEIEAAREELAGAEEEMDVVAHNLRSMNVPHSIWIQITEEAKPKFRLYMQTSNKQEKAKLKVEL